MKTNAQSMPKFMRARRGVSLTGYALVVGLIAVIALTAIGRVGGSVSALMTGVGNKLATAGNSTIGSGNSGGTPAAPNVAPSFSGSVSPLTLQRNAAMTPVDITGFSDANNDSLTFSAIGSWPAGLSLVKQNDTTVRIQGTPTTAGIYASLSIRASDGSLFVDTASFTITVDACLGSPTPGTVCADDSVYAGQSPDGNVPMFAQRCDVGMAISGGICSGSRTKFAWNDGSSNWVDTALGNCTTYDTTAPCAAGKSNSAFLYTADSSTAGGFQYHLAAKYCEELTESGHSDWYLPAYTEMSVMYANRATIGGFATSGALTDRYHSSSESSLQVDVNPDMNNGDQATGSLNKASGLNIRCVRR